VRVHGLLISYDAKTGLAFWPQSASLDTPLAFLLLLFIDRASTMRKLEREEEESGYRAIALGTSSVKRRRERWDELAICSEKERAKEKINATT